MSRLFDIRLALCFVAVVLATLAGATFAQAVDQESKNGCTSPQVYTGSLTSPTFTTTVANPDLTFQGWFEIEGVAPTSFDQTVIEYSTDGVNWFEFGRLPDPLGGGGGGNSDQPFSNNGLGVAPSFQQFTFTLPLAAQSGIRIRFRFDTGDETFQGFRGVGLDQVNVASSTLPRQGFEGTAPGWTFDPASGPGGPFWQILTNPQNVRVKSPEINPDLVTLPDAGALPAPVSGAGTGVAWFGNVASGTFCGPDFANRIDTIAPETTVTSGPPSSTSSHDATFSFISSDPGSFFLCGLDGPPSAPCSSPQSYSALASGAHSFQVMAIDSLGNADPTPAVYGWTIRPARLADLPRPTLGVDVNVQVASGTVLLGVRPGAARTAGAHASQKGLTFVPLTEARQIPVGSFLDTKRGTLQLVSATGATRGNRTQSGKFSGGLFQVLQSRKRRSRGLTELRLKGSSFRRCRTGRRGKAGAAQLRRRTIRRVRGNTKGRFGTRGRGASATTRGTIWTMADRCDGTLTTVKRGKVAVRDFRKKRTIIVRAGKSYLAKVAR